MTTLTPEAREIRRIRRAIHAALRLLRHPVGQHHVHAGEAARVLGKAIETEGKKR